MMCFIAIVVISIGTSIIHGILNLFLGLFGRPRQPYGQAEQGSQRTRTHKSQTHQATSSDNKRREKIFDKSDGEYVEFEEL